MVNKITRLTKSRPLEEVGKTSWARNTLSRTLSNVREPANFNITYVVQGFDDRGQTISTDGN